MNAAASTAPPLQTPHAFFHHATLCPTLASARRAISSMVGNKANAGLQQCADYFERTTSC